MTKVGQKESVLRKGGGEREGRLRVGFWGGEVVVEIQCVGRERRKVAGKKVPEVLLVDEEELSSVSSLSSSSSEEEEDEDEEEEEDDQEEDEEEEDTEAECSDSEPELIHRASSPTHSDPSLTPQKPTLPIPCRPIAPSPPPQGIDLASLLSSALVFSRQTSLTLADLTKAVLEANPALLDKGQRARWESWLEAELEAGSMWGRIVRVGKVRSSRSRSLSTNGLTRLVSHFWGVWWT